MHTERHDLDPRMGDPLTHPQELELALLAVGLYVILVGVPLDVIVEITA